MARPRAVHDLVKCLETYVGGNVKVSEWPIQCTVASGRETGPLDLSLCLFGTFAALTSARRRRGEEVRQLCFREVSTRFSFRAIDPSRQEENDGKFI